MRDRLMVRAKNAPPRRHRLLEQRFGGGNVTPFPIHLRQTGHEVLRVGMVWQYAAAGLEAVFEQRLGIGVTLLRHVYRGEAEDREQRVVMFGTERSATA